MEKLLCASPEVLSWTSFPMTLEVCRRSAAHHRSKQIPPLIIQKSAPSPFQFSGGAEDSSLIIGRATGCYVHALLGCPPSMAGVCRQQAVVQLTVGTFLYFIVHI